MPLIALEEHYAWDPVSADNVVGNWLRDNDVDTYRRLYDRGEIRLQQMDAAGIDFQILSLFDPGVQDDTDAARAVDLLDPGRKAGHPGSARGRRLRPRAPRRPSRAHARRVTRRAPERPTSAVRHTRAGPILAAGLGPSG